MSYGSMTISSFAKATQFALRVASRELRLLENRSQPQDLIQPPSDAPGVRQGSRQQLTDELALTGDARTDGYVRLLASLVAQRGGDWRGYLEGIKKTQQRFSAAGSSSPNGGAARAVV